MYIKNQYLIYRQCRYLDTVMPMHNLLEYSDNYSMISGSLWNNNILDTEAFVPLKYLSNIWRSIVLPLINCEMEIDLSWSKEYIICEIFLTPKIAGNPHARPPV